MNQMQAVPRSGFVYRPHVLLVEDEFSVAKGLEMVMTEEGYDVDLADTGKEALHKFWTKDHFDLMVADLRLPDIDGMEVIQRVKDKRPETKVIIITGYPSVSSAVQAAKMGISDYLHKPFTDDQFLAAVGTALKEKGSMEDLISETQKDRLIQRQEVIRILDRAYQNHSFWIELMEGGPEALKGSRLTNTAKAAILSGDLGWIQANVGELNDQQLLFINSRLQREAW